MSMGAMAGFPRIFRLWTCCQAAPGLAAPVPLVGAAKG